MSSADKPADLDEVCASCGIKEGGDNNIKLKRCDACKLVKYCSVECQRKHRPRHEFTCKLRAAVLRDELLFQQPDCTHFGDCPICFVPIPFEIDDGVLSSAGYYFCCNKYICTGCRYQSKVQGMVKTCPFCRTPQPKNNTEMQKLFDKQLERGNPDALRQQSFRCNEKGNYNEAYEYMLRASKGGDIEAHLQLAHMYVKSGVKKDMKKAIFLAEEGAIAGHPKARLVLGDIESNYGNYERAVKHWIIGSKLGSKDALEQLKQGYKDGSVSKEAFEEGLRGYQKAVNEMKTPQREVAKQNFHLLGVSYL